VFLENIRHLSREPMKRWLMGIFPKLLVSLGALASLIAGFVLVPIERPAGAATLSRSVVQVVTAPGGQANYYIFKLTGSEGNKSMDIEAGLNGNTSFEVLVKEAPSGDPKSNLSNFSNLNLSPDSRLLYFESEAWVTENAIYAVDLSTKSVRFVTSGELACVVLRGEYQGDLVVQQHHYFVQGGSHDDLYLFTPDGKGLGMVAEGTDASHVCPTLDPP
jgi:hypothetical protein